MPSAAPKADKVPSTDELIEIYNRALKSGNTGAADVASTALKAIAKAEGSETEARRLAVLANHM